MKNLTTEQVLARIRKGLVEGEARDESGRWTSGESKLPERTADTMSEAIALSSPSGKMSARARAAAEARLSERLFGPGGLKAPGLPEQPSEKERLLRQAKELRDLAAGGMSPRKFTREADRLEQQARSIK